MRIRAFGIHCGKKVCTAVMSESTAPYKFIELWQMMLIRNSTISTGPSPPVAWRTASMASSLPATRLTATTPNTKAKMVPLQAPR